MSGKRWIAVTLFAASIVLTSGWLAQAQELSATATDVVRLAPDASSATSPFQVSDASGVVFDAVATVPGVRVAVVSPAGTRYDETTIGAIGGTAERRSISSPSASPLVDPTATPGEHVIFTIPTPLQGEWIVELGAPSGNTSEIAVATTMILNSPTGVGLFALPEEIVLGQVVNLTLAAFSGDQPFTGGTVAAQIVAPDGTVSPLTLLDNGVLPDRAVNDGLYAAVFVAGQVGTFDVLARLTGVSSTGAPLVREGAATFEVVPVTLAILGNVGTRTIDANFNGLIDELVLDVSVTVAQAGEFVVHAQLKATNGNTLTRSAHATLATSDTLVSVHFAAEDVRGLGVNGPYEIGPVEIVFVSPTGSQPADRVENAGQTPPFLLSAFERPAIDFAGGLTDAGVDLDGDGLFDRLNVNLDMQFAFSGFYQWSAILFDVHGTQIGFATGSGNRSAGAGVIQLTFNGQTIGANGVDGPYLVGNLLVTGAGRSLLLLQVAQTSPFRAREFEGFVGNGPPTAVAGAGQTLECTAAAGTSVTLDGSASTDPDGDPLTFVWKDSSGAVVGTTAIVTLSLPLGTHTFTLTVNDGRGGTDSESVSITVRDTTAPAITALTATPNILWPPNHEMIDVGVAATVSDACSSVAPACSIVRITSNEAGGPDWEIVGAMAAKLRAERLGTGTARMYTLEVQCTDSSGNSATSHVVVTVPHDQGQ